MWRVLNMARVIPILLVTAMLTWPQCVDHPIFVDMGGLTFPQPNTSNLSLLPQCTFQKTNMEAKMTFMNWKISRQGINEAAIRLSQGSRNTTPNLGSLHLFHPKII